MRHDDIQARARAWRAGFAAAKRRLADALAEAEEDLLREFLARETMADNGKQVTHGTQKHQPE